MNDRELEKKIRDSYANVAPDILGSVLADCDKQKGQVIVMQKKKKNNRFEKIAAGIAAALMLLIGTAVIRNVYLNNHAVASTITLDVNPSIQISVNKNEKVLEVITFNDDARVVVGNMDFVGSKLDVTVNALIGSMLRNGYLSEAANSILVSVDSRDSSAGKVMQAKLMSGIDSVLASGNVAGAVLGQTLTSDNDIRKLADQYGITAGKATLIRQITQQNTFYSFGDLISLSINELNLISESGSTKLDNVASIGTTSSSAYIGQDAAKAAAYEHAGVNVSDVIKSKCELDWEKGIMVYEVDFDTAEFEFEYEINAKTGDVVKYEKEKNDEVYVPSGTKENGSGSSDKNYIGETAAKEAAEKHAGVSGNDISGYSCELDHEHGITVYDVEFKANGYEYDYCINALTGDVVKHSVEKDD